jgi:hypothetical protein
MLQRLTFPAIALALSMVGCNAKAPAPGQQSAPPEPPRWTITPVASEPMPVGGSHYWSAWRLDTKTGALEFCTFIEGDPVAKTAAQALEHLDCTAPVKASDE